MAKGARLKQRWRMLGQGSNGRWAGRLLAIQHVNSETGTINPVSDMAEKHWDWRAVGEGLRIAGAYGWA